MKRQTGPDGVGQAKLERDRDWPGKSINTLQKKGRERRKRDNNKQKR